MFEIVRAGEADVERVYELECACFDDPWGINFISDEIVLRKKPYFICLLEGEHVGYCGLHIVLDEACITNICVHPKFRGKGGAGHMMRAMMSFSLQKKATAMTLEVRVSNAPAISLYEGWGFEGVGVRKGYYADGEAALIMWNYDIAQTVKL